jgi:hypothetical protein
MEVYRSVRRVAYALILPLLAGAAGCESPLSERTIDLDATGAARVMLFLDNNLNARFDPTADLLLTDRAVVVRRVGVADSTLAETDETGVARIDDLGIGRYVATVPGSVRGDTLVSALDTVEFQIGPLDTATVVLAVQYPVLDVETFRALAIGRKAWTRGIVYNVPGTFGDSTMHLADTTAAIRAISVRNLSVQIGDTLALLGTRRARSGQPAIEPQFAMWVTGEVNPPAEPVTTAEAATADGGELDAAFVAVRNATVTDTATTIFPAARLLTVNDGSGPLTVSLHPGINPTGIFAPGVVLDEIRGLLVPDPNGSRWILRPRMTNDIVPRGTTTPP